jgi:hypothetical protein
MPNMLLCILYVYIVYQKNSLMDAWCVSTVVLLILGMVKVAAAHNIIHTGGGAFFGKGHSSARNMKRQMYCMQPRWLRMEQIKHMIRKLYSPM